MRRILIAGTGTGVGKTYFSTAARAALAGSGQRVVALKPIESGYDDNHSDAQRIGGPGWHRPAYRFERALSPHLAARLEGRSVDLTVVADWILAHAAASDVALIETAGGMFSPLTDRGETSVDLLRRLLPCDWLLVASNRLGVLHDVGAVVAATQGKVPPPIAIVVNAVDPDHSSPSNASELARLHPETRVLSVTRGGRASEDWTALLASN